MYALLAAGFDVSVGLFHLMFWRLFGWPSRLQPAGRLNAAITQTLNIMLTYVLFAYAAALTWGTLGTGPQVTLIWIGAGFWILRASLQPLRFPLRPGLNAVRHLDGRCRPPCLGSRRLTRQAA